MQLVVNINISKNKINLKYFLYSQPSGSYLRGMVDMS